MSRTVTHRRKIVFAVTCPHCQARYQVHCVREFGVRPQGEDDAPTRGARPRLKGVMTDPMAVHRCPGCGRFGPGALSALLQMLGFAAGVSILGLAGAAVFLELALAGSNLLFLVLGLLSAAAVPAGLVLAVLIVLSPINCRTRLTGRPAGAYRRRSSRISQRSLPGA